MRLFFKPNNNIPSPATYKIEYPPLLRVELLQQMAANIRSGFANFTSSEYFKSLPFSGRVAVMLTGMDGLNKIAHEFDKEAFRISQSLPSINDLRDLEKRGQLIPVVAGYEILIAAGFPGSLPYDRLRIIYTRENKYGDAIRVCRRYISVLKQLSTFNPTYPNIWMIPEFEDWIRKLEKKHLPEKRG